MSGINENIVRLCGLRNGIAIGLKDNIITYICNDILHYIINLPYTNIKTLNIIISYLEKGYIVIISGTKRDAFIKISSKYHINIFYEEELLYCPLDHELVPIHRLATSDEIHNTDITVLPKILSSDVICRWMNFNKDDIITIEREDGNYYRVVDF